MAVSAPNHELVPGDISQKLPILILFILTRMNRRSAAHDQGSETSHLELSLENIKQHNASSQKRARWSIILLLHPADPRPRNRS